MLKNAKQKEEKIRVAKKKLISMIREMLSVYSKRRGYLLHFEFQNLRELKNLGAWKQTWENFLILVLQWGK